MGAKVPGAGRVWSVGERNICRRLAIGNPGYVTVSHSGLGRLKCTCPYRLHAHSQLRTIHRHFRSRQDERAPYECRSTKSLCERKTTIVLLDQSTRQR